MSPTLECPYCGPTCPVGWGKCHDGCGADTKIATDRRKGILGEPYRFILGHNERRALQQKAIRECTEKAKKECYYCGVECLTGAGLCHCGCGQRTTIATRTEKGRVRGVPSKWRPRHHDRQRLLTDEQVAEIRRRYLEGATETVLAFEYEVHQTSISKLLLFDTYKEAGVASGE